MALCDARALSPGWTGNPFRAQHSVNIVAHSVPSHFTLTRVFGSVIHTYGDLPNPGKLRSLYHAKKQFTSTCRIPSCTKPTTLPTHISSSSSSSSSFHSLRLITTLFNLPSCLRHYKKSSFKAVMALTGQRKVTKLPSNTRAGFTTLLQLTISTEATSKWPRRPSRQLERLLMGLV